MLEAADSAPGRTSGVTTALIPLAEASETAARTRSRECAPSPAAARTGRPAGRARMSRCSSGRRGGCPLPVRCRGPGRRTPSRSITSLIHTRSAVRVPSRAGQEVAGRRWRPSRTGAWQGRVCRACRGPDVTKALGRRSRYAVVARARGPAGRRRPPREPAALAQNTTGRH